MPSWGGNALMRGGGLSRVSALVAPPPLPMWIIQVAYKYEKQTKTVKTYFFQFICSQKKY